MPSSAPVSTGATPSAGRDPVLWAVALAALLTCAPFMDYVPWLGDEGVLLHGADRILSGERLYADVFGFLPPGGYLLFAGWFGVAGTSLTSAKVLSIAVIGVISVAIYLAGKAGGGGALLPALLALAWLVATQGDGTVANHHWLTTMWSMLAGLAAVAALDDRERSAPALLAGLFIGAAAMSTSTRGALLALAVFAVLLACRRPTRQLAIAAAGVCVVPGLCLIYLAATGTLGDAYACVIEWPATQYAGIQGLAYGAGASVQSRPVVVALPVAGLLGARAWLTRRGEPRVLLAVAMLAVAAVGTLPRPDAVHLGYVAPLCVFAIAGGAGPWPQARRRSLGLALVFVVLVAPAALKIVRLGGKVTAMPAIVFDRGSAALDGRNSPEELAAVADAIAGLPAGATVFVYPYAPMLSFLTGRRHVGRFDILTPGYSSAREYQQTCEAVLEGAEWVVFDRRWASTRQLRATWPALREPQPPEKLRLEAAILGGFEPVLDTGRYALLRRGARTPTCR